jgi:hypothetical protein
MLLMLQSTDIVNFRRLRISVSAEQTYITISGLSLSHENYAVAIDIIQNNSEEIWRYTVSDQ